MTTPTTGYQAEPGDIAAEVADHLAGITDPLELYHRATTAQTHHQAVAAALQTERDKALALLNTPNPDGHRLTYADLAEQVAVGITPSGVQKAVERGRRALGH